MKKWLSVCVGILLFIIIGFDVVTADDQDDHSSFDVHISSHKILAGEGFELEVIAPLANMVSVSFPSPNEVNEWMTVDLIQGDNANWILPVAFLYSDGRVVYENIQEENPLQGEGHRGGRKIYTPFFWQDQYFPVVVTVDDVSEQIDVEIEGYLLNHLIYRPVDPRNPFPFGVSPIWEDHSFLFGGD